MHEKILKMGVFCEYFYLYFALFWAFLQPVF